MSMTFHLMSFGWTSNILMANGNDIHFVVSVTDFVNYCVENVIQISHTLDTCETCNTINILIECTVMLKKSATLLLQISNFYA